MLGSAKTGTITATPDCDSDIYRRYAIGLYRQALSDRRSYILETRLRDLAASVRTALRRSRGQAHE
jgi:hypothetical protein